jgi:hypothetical protein
MCWKPAILDIVGELIRKSLEIVFQAREFSFYSIEKELEIRYPQPLNAIGTRIRDNNLIHVVN